MKHLANCTPIEFLAQTNKIRKAVSHWLTVTDIKSIRSRVPKYEIAAKDATADERAEIVKRNSEARQQQILENADAILTACCEDHPSETLEVLALTCFINPAEANEHVMSEYMAAIGEMLSDPGVISFFTSLERLGRINTLASAKA